MGISIIIRRDGLIPKVTKTDARKLRTAMLFGIAAEWHKLFLPGKFTAAGARKYHYRKRKTKEIRTGKIKGKRKAGLPISGDPLVWTGHTREQAKSRSIRANSKRSHCVMPVGHLNRYRPEGWPSGQLRFELTQVLPQEQVTLAQKAERAFRSKFSKGKKNIQVHEFRS